MEPPSHTLPWLKGIFAVAKKKQNQSECSDISDSTQWELICKHKTSPPSKWETGNFLQVLIHGSFHRSQIGFQPEALKKLLVRIANNYRQFLSC